MTIAAKEGRSANVDVVERQQKSMQDAVIYSPPVGIHSETTTWPHRKQAADHSCHSETSVKLIITKLS